MSVTNSAQTDSAKTKGHPSNGISPGRLAAYQILKRVEEEGAYASILLATWDELPERDRALCYELTMGVLRRQLTLDWLIAHYANRDAGRLDAAVRRVLRLGLYQLRFLSRVPPSAAVNDAVKLVRFARVRSADKFVNAVLRRAVRESDYDPLTGISDPLERIAVGTSHPRWLIERWSLSLGLSETEAFARANNEPPPISFRLTAPVSDKNEVLDQLGAAGATLVASRLVRNAWRISGATSILRRFAQQGRIYVQDEASQLVGQLLDPMPGQLVLDLCAAPGSKTTHIAALAQGKAVVVAGDLHEHRLQMINHAAHIQNLRVHCVALDGERPPFKDATFDRVLVDAPCSGTGTLRRNPEIRWRISPADIEELSNRQKRLLHSAARAVKPGGRLVYSTCSVEIEENEAVTKEFLEGNSSFFRIQLPVDPELVTEAGAVRTWPHRRGTEGFFIAAFERSNYFGKRVQRTKSRLVGGKGGL
ncbi:MAG TPA: 16S rRNA (cytosine(967)-C(5))-methyltransferase RsmB [Pyrinomonadaceae bacterium]|nr:16S rRNA (cytosine(967)-C(5))-methyltransferase RsmB [Pyrinomonadaceae bacterium]